MKLNEYDTVRVISLLKADRAFYGTDGVRRMPAVGDVGTIVHDGGGGVFVVEKVDDVGNTVWLADFTSDELTLLSRPRPSSDRPKIQN